ncbi:MAG: META domain-containing protein, partial [Chloroflexi bacterium]|nr:META domain-containing protein [Chloroflexota bacterium]
QGRETRLDFLGEWAWRSTITAAKGGDLEAFVRESTCRDGMSDTKHPMVARISLPDGRLLAGCCRVPVLASSFEGPTWRLTALGSRDVAGLATDPVTARFEAGRVSGFSGCNRFTGAYTMDGDSVIVGRLAGTMMACTDPRMALEKAFLGGLTGKLRQAISGDRLTLTPATGEALGFQVQPAPTLEGVDWGVTGFNNGRQAVVSPLLGTTLTMTFSGGMVRGSSGCNTFRAPYTSEGNRLSIGPVTSTRMACPAEDVMQQEREFLAALESAKVWAMDGSMLDIHRADGERVLNAFGTGR